jgi:hypothetical protein
VKRQKNKRVTELISLMFLALVFPCSYFLDDDDDDDDDDDTYSYFLFLLRLGFCIPSLERNMSLTATVSFLLHIYHKY